MSFFDEAVDAFASEHEQRLFSFKKTTVSQINDQLNQIMINITIQPVKPVDFIFVDYITLLK